MNNKIIIIFVLIFILPLLLNGFNFLYFIYLIIVPFTLFKSKQNLINSYINLDIYKFLKRYLILFVFIAFVLYYFGNLKILDRSTHREGVINYNSGFLDFFGSLISYFIIVFNGFNFSKYLFDNNKFNLLLAIVGSSLLFFLTGTRWLFVLSMSPIITHLLMTSQNRKIIIFVPIAFIFSLFIAMIRSGKAKLTLFSAFYWDVPSFQSYYIVENYSSSVLKGFNSFLNGNILILVPRFLWSNKPDDYVVIEYMRKELGARYDVGATILPGLIGSFHLYGGVLFTIIILIILRILLIKLNTILTETSSYKMFSFASMVVIGVILQFRGISIAYFLPALFQIVWILIYNSGKNRVL